MCHVGLIHFFKHQRKHGASPTLWCFRSGRWVAFGSTRSAVRVIATVAGSSLSWQVTEYLLEPLRRCCQATFCSGKPGYVILKCCAGPGSLCPQDLRDLYSKGRVACGTCAKRKVGLLVAEVGLRHQSGAGGRPGFRGDPEGGARHVADSDSHSVLPGLACDFCSFSSTVSTRGSA